MQRRIVVSLLAAATVVLAGCASAPDKPGRYKVGKPYTIKGQTYYPQENYAQEQTGVASWYGPGFHGKQTANGERFDQNAMTAAHPTLQMPSLVRVTNVNNGLSTIVRVNDRGPFHGGRIIDLSKAASEALGFRNMGTAQVRVQVLGPESMALAAAAKRGVDTRNAEVAMNRNGALDSKFAAFFPNTVAQPEPGIMVAGAGYQPAMPAGASLGTATLAVPEAPGIVLAQQAGAGLPVIPAAKPQFMGDNTMQAAVAPAHAPVFQMAPISEANAAEIHQRAAATPGMPVQALGQTLGQPVGVDASHIYVHAGAAMSRASAVALSEQVGAFGPARIVPDGNAQMPYFRVRIGPLESVEKADHVVNTLQRQGRQASIVVSQN